jgi:hypothetical protein
MLAFVHAKAGDRKLRLFTCACCRRLWHLLADEASRAAVVTAELAADGLVQTGALRQACGRANAAYRARRQLAGRTSCLVEGAPAYWAASATADASRVAWLAAEDAAALSARGLHLPGLVALLAAGARQPECQGRRSACVAEENFQSQLLRCIIGNPFRPAAIDPSWLTAPVVGLARAAYDLRDFGRLADLADALEEAGYGDAGVLGHLRAKDGHARGCWAVDLILGKG